MTNSLDAYILNLVPASYDREITKLRREKIISTLQNSDLDYSTLWEIGSFSHGTGIRDHCDVDYMVTFGVGKTVLPSSFLTSLKKVLDTADSYIYNVKISSPALRVEYFSGPIFEIVPGFIGDVSGKFNTYDIPGPSDKWIDSAPEAHFQYVNDANDVLSKKVKSLVRLLKAWKYANSIPISSFYLEMRVAEYSLDESSIIYDIDLDSVFHYLINKDLADMNDPMGYVGRFSPCSSEADRLTCLAAMKRAVVALEAAEAYKDAGSYLDYWLKMVEVFPAFPYESESWG